MHFNPNRPFFVYIIHLIYDSHFVIIYLCYHYYYLCIYLTASTTTTNTSLIIISISQLQIKWFVVYFFQDGRV